MNAITLLTEDHRAMKKLLKELGETEGPKTREELFSRIERDLTAHEAIEEEIFYPALRDHPKAKEIVLEGYVEHDVVERLMGELGRLAFDDEMWGPKAKVMTENIEHHIEEEEGEMFEKARQVFEDEELRQLGERMAERRKELLAEAAGSRTG